MPLSFLKTAQRLIIAWHGDHFRDNDFAKALFIIPGQF